MDIQFTGKVYKVLPTKHGMGQKGPWAIATVVFDLDGEKFPTKVACSNSRDAEKFAALQQGQTVKVYADISSREYQEKWFTSLSAWKWDVVGQPAPQVPPPAPQGDLPF